MNANEETITANDPGYQGAIGPNVGLTFFDVKAINLAYCSGESHEINLICINFSQIKFIVLIYVCLKESQLCRYVLLVEC